MQYGTVSGSAKKISRLVQGCIMLTRSRKEEGFALLDATRQAGITAYDTAHGYGGGEVDRTLGLWMEERGNRDEVVIIGKGAHHNQDRNRVTPYDIAADLADSLARLRSDYNPSSCATISYRIRAILPTTTSVFVRKRYKYSPDATCAPWSSRLSQATVCDPAGKDSAFKSTRTRCPDRL